jgi:hypothetical protein
MQLSLTIEALERAEKRISVLAHSGDRKLLGALMVYRDWLVEEVQKWNQRVQAERGRENGSDRQRPQ